MLIRSGIILIKYWFSITDDEQNSALHHAYPTDPLVTVEAESDGHGVAPPLGVKMTTAKETMLERTHIPEAPWWIVEAVDKKGAGLNCIRHLLGQIPYAEVEREPGCLARAGAQPGLPATPGSQGDDCSAIY